jgi:hypothetical protein
MSSISLKAAVVAGIKRLPRGTNVSQGFLQPRSSLLLLLQAGVAGQYSNTQREQELAKARMGLGLGLFNCGLRCWWQVGGE